MLKSQHFNTKYNLATQMGILISHEKVANHTHTQNNNIYVFNN